MLQQERKQSLFDFANVLEQTLGWLGPNHAFSSLPDLALPSLMLSARLASNSGPGLLRCPAVCACKPSMMSTMDISKRQAVHG